jgi:hypothetical protein
MWHQADMVRRSIVANNQPIQIGKSLRSEKSASGWKGGMMPLAGHWTSERADAEHSTTIVPYMNSVVAPHHEKEFTFKFSVLSYIGKIQIYDDNC